MKYNTNGKYPWLHGIDWCMERCWALDFYYTPVQLKHPLKSQNRYWAQSTLIYYLIISASWPIFHTDITFQEQADHQEQHTYIPPSVWMILLNMNYTRNCLEQYYLLHSSLLQCLLLYCKSNTVWNNLWSMKEYEHIPTLGQPDFLSVTSLKLSQGDI